MLAISSFLDPRLKLIFIKLCYKRTFNKEESKKKIDNIHACLYKLYNKYVDIVRVQIFVDLSEITFEFCGPSDISSVSSFSMEKINNGIFEVKVI